MNCCNQNCQQGLRCPNKESGFDPFYLVVIIGLILIFGVVGYFDYEAALVTEQIVKSATP